MASAPTGQSAARPEKAETTAAARTQAKTTSAKNLRAEAQATADALVASSSAPKVANAILAQVAVGANQNVAGVLQESQKSLKDLLNKLDAARADLKEAAETTSAAAGSKTDKPELSSQRIDKAYAAYDANGLDSGMKRAA